MSAIRRDAVRDAILRGQSPAQIAEFFTRHFLDMEVERYKLDRIGVEFAREVRQDYRKTIARDIAHHRKGLVLALHEGWQLTPDQIAERLECREATVRRDLEWWGIFPTRTDLPAGVADLGAHRTRRVLR